MATVEAPAFRAKILGEVTLEQRNLLGYFLADNGLNEFAKLLPANLRTEPFFRNEPDPTKVIHELNPLLVDLATERLFTREPRCNTRILPPPYNEAWALFVSSATQALGRSHLRRQGIITSDDTLVSQNEVRIVLPHYQRTRITVGTTEFWGGESTNSFAKYGIPGDTVVSPSPIAGVDVTRIIDYSANTPLADRTIRVRHLRHTLTSKYGKRYLRFALASNLPPHIGSELVNIPDLDNGFPKTQLVVGSESASPAPTSQTTEVYDEPIKIGMPSMEVFSFWLLRILTGDIPKQSDWRNHFQPTERTKVG